MTLEPCSMCAGAIALARCQRVVWGCRNSRLGYTRFESHRQGAGCRCDGNSEGDDVATTDGVAEPNAIIPGHPYHRVLVSEGVLEGECASLLKEFFRARRGKDGDAGVVGDRATQEHP